MIHTAQPSLLERSLAGETLNRPPVWFMRQAGRYLPEYRALRSTAPDFVAFCLDPIKASEATLQPMQRFPFDAAIVFADILLIPGALGQQVWFEAGEGPRLGPLPTLDAMIDKLDTVCDHLSPVGETLGRVRQGLDASRGLIGFAGAPWTVLTYMLEGRSSDRVNARTLAYTEPERVDRLLEVLVDATARYLVMQARCGAQALQIFESWAEGLSESLFRRLVLEPHRKILQQVRDAGVLAPIIGFPRGCGALIEDYAAEVDVEGVALDTQTSIAVGRRVQKRRTIQGALDPLLLRAGGSELARSVDTLLEQWGQGPYVFNLGHGILPDTPIAHVEAVLTRVTGIAA